MCCSRKAHGRRRVPSPSSCRTRQASTSKPSGSRPSPPLRFSCCDRARSAPSPWPRSPALPSSGWGSDTCDHRSEPVPASPAQRERGFMEAVRRPLFPFPACGGGRVGGRFRASGSGGAARPGNGPSHRETLPQLLPPSGRGAQRTAPRAWAPHCAPRPESRIDAAGMTRQRACRAAIASAMRSTALARSATGTSTILPSTVIAPSPRASASS